MAVTKAAGRKTKSSLDDFHLRSVTALQDANVPFLIGGAYVVEVYAGGSRRTKDFDLYGRPHHVEAALKALGCAGYAPDPTFPPWLRQAQRGRDYAALC